MKPSFAHNALTTVVDADGEEIDIVRDNMPFGHAARGEHGTYFIGYARSPATIELMLTNMFVGRPPGNYDRLLDVSRAVTGSLFFVPSMPLLESLADDPAGGADESGRDGSTARTAQARPARARTAQRETTRPEPHHPTPPDHSASAAYEE